MDFAFLMKKEPKTEVVGDPWTEPLMKTKPLTPNSNLEAKLEETPQTLTLLSPDQEEIDIAKLAQLILSHISKPPIQPRSLAGAMAQIASMTTLTNSLMARTLGTGVSQRGNTTSAKGILQTMFPSQHDRGNGGGDDPPEPHR